ncbi:LptF/LptG family permease [uncultured Roseibium sp.]|uniref:LptF/LptG family permease n=1 Tax=uncultured Roseibium sp. TaxID=1936171 RepID=UPI00321788AA
MNTLQRYIFGRIAVLSAGTFVAVVVVVWVTQILTRIDFTTISAQSLASFGLAIVLMTPQLLSLLLPVSVVIALVQVFTTMNSDSEMAVMSAAGVSRGTIAKPALIIGLIAGLYVIVSNHFIEPRTSRALRDVLVSLRSDLLANFLQEGVFTRLDKNLVIYVDKRLPGNVLGGIMVSDTRDEKTSLIYYAQSGNVGKINGNDVLVMTNGQVQNKRAEDGSISVIRFNSYAISLSQFGSAESANFYYPQERDTVDLFYPDPNDRVAKGLPSWLRGEIHRRMTDWLYPILYVLIGLVVAGQTQSHRQARLYAFALAFGGALAYKGIGYTVYGLNRHNGDLWWLFYAVPLGGIAINAFLYWRGITLRIPDPALRALDRFGETVRKLRVRQARARAA